MHESETQLLDVLSRGRGTRTVLGGSGAVKERIQHARAMIGDAPDASCGGVGGGWGNSPVEAVDGSCGGVGGGWGNSPEF